MNYTKENVLPCSTDSYDVLLTRLAAAAISLSPMVGIINDTIGYTRSLIHSLSSTPCLKPNMWYQQQNRSPFLQVKTIDYMKKENAPNLMFSTTAPCRERKAFGQALLDNQYIHFRLAELLTEVSKSCLLFC